jgi:hypothetical protein
MNNSGFDHPRPPPQHIKPNFPYVYQGEEIPKEKKYREIVHYVSIESSERNVERKNGNVYGFPSPNRYRVRLENTYRNVVGVELVSAVIPLTIGDVAKTSNKLIDEPYLLLHVEETGGIYDSNNINVHNALAKISIDRCDWQGKFIRDCPGGGRFLKKFVPTPLASLSTLTVQFVTKNGCLFDFGKDNINFDCTCGKASFESDAASNLIKNSVILVELHGDNGREGVLVSHFIRYDNNCTTDGQNLLFHNSNYRYSKTGEVNSDCNTDEWSTDFGDPEEGDPNFITLEIINIDNGIVKIPLKNINWNSIRYVTTTSNLCPKKCIAGPTTWCPEPEKKYTYISYNNPQICESASFMNMFTAQDSGNFYDSNIITNVTETEITITTQINVDNGTIYALAVPHGNPPPSPSDIKDIVNPNSGSTEANTAVEIDIFGLTASTTYDVYLYAEDNANNPTDINCCNTFTVTTLATGESNPKIKIMSECYSCKCKEDKCPKFNECIQNSLLFAITTREENSFDLNNRNINLYS